MAQVPQDLKQLFQGFSKLNLQERLGRLEEMGLLTGEDLEYLNKGGLRNVSLGEKFIENVIGYFQMPMGVATHFRIDHVDYVIPMAVEETSIIAAASKTAKWIREKGEITTKVVGQTIIGQIQCSKVKSFELFKSQVLKQKEHLIELANKEVAFGLVKRGGGI